MLSAGPPEASESSPAKAAKGAALHC